MGKKKLKRRVLARILSSYGVDEIKKRGKGSHTVFSMKTDDGTFTYPIPKGKDVKDCYVKGARRRFNLTVDDGVTDEDFFGRA